MNNQMKLALSSFKEKMDEMGIDFIVGGSLALETLGVPLKREPHDIDMECVCTPEQEKFFSILSDSCGNNLYRSIYPEKGKAPYVFNWAGVIFNVWAFPEFTYKVFVYKNFLKYAGMSSVLQKKMAYGRAKDYQDLNYIIKTLMPV